VGRGRLSDVASPIHLAGLNGLRAISAIGVVLSHTLLSIDRYAIGRFADGSPRGLDLAVYGVVIFFTISGFLITYLLIKERELRQRIDVKRFYIRRILRIWPLYYIYFILAIAITVHAGKQVGVGSFALYTLFAANYASGTAHSIPLLVHYWSLGVEEQFYLFWPWVMRWCGARMLKVTVLVAAGLIVARVICARVLVPHDIVLPDLIMGKINFQYMLIGCAGAMLWTSRATWFLRLFTSRWVQGAAWLSLALVAVNRFPAPSIIANEAVSVVALALIIGQVSRKNHLIDLEHKAWDALGRISYGIYVIHPLIILGLAAFTHQWSDLPASIRLVAGCAAVCALTWAIAWLSYRYLEAPMLRIKERFTVVRTAASMVADAPKPRDPALRPGLIG
jgi:peptidoglycan/LPS O-acetylase OafA/YrhL